MNQQLLFEGDKVSATSPEGKQSSMAIVDFLKALNPQRIDTGPFVLPDGVKGIRSAGGGMVVVHQTPPRVFNLKWLKDNSPAPYGSRATYQNVTVAMPYILTIGFFAKGLLIMNNNECFFRNEPLTSWEDELFFPALLNCSKFYDDADKSWICTQHLALHSLHQIKPDQARLVASLKGLLHCLFETGFNRSSENHEGDSWYNASRGVDPRIGKIGEWEKATKVDPLFVLEVPWLKTGRTMGQTADRMLEQGGCASNDDNLPRTADQLARVVFAKR